MEISNDKRIIYRLRTCKLCTSILLKNFNHINDLFLLWLNSDQLYVNSISVKH